METEIFAAQFSNLDIYALDKCQDLHKLLFCTNAASVARLAPLIISIAQGPFAVENIYMCVCVCMREREREKKRVGTRPVE